MNGVNGNKGPTLVEQPLAQSTGPQESVEGRSSWGMTVSCEEGMSLLQEAVNESLQTGDNKALDERKTALPSQKVDTSPEELGFEDSVEHLENLDSLIDVQNEDGEEVAYFDAAEMEDKYQWVTDSELKEAEQRATKALDGGRFAKVKMAANKLKSAFSHFVQKLRPTPKVAGMMAEAVTEFVDKSAPEGATKAEVMKEAAHAANLLGDNPEALLNEMEAKDMGDTVAALRKEIKVATKANLGKMKSRLLDPSNVRDIPATQGMSPKMTELMVNATLIASKLADPKGGEANAIKDRGYLWGKIPKSKYAVMEWLLRMPPEMAVAALSTHPRLKGTNFLAQFNKLQAEFTPDSGKIKFNDHVEMPFGGMAEVETEGTPEDVFESGALSMFEEAEEAASQNEDAFVKRTIVGKAHTEAGHAGVVSAQILKDGLGKLNKGTETKVTDGIHDGVKEKYLQDQDMQKAKAAKEVLKDYPNAIASEGLQRKYRNKYAGGLLPAAQDTADGIYKDLHKEVQSLVKGEAPDRTWGYDAMNVANAIMVDCGFAVFKSKDSSEEITMTMHGSQDEGLREEDMAAKALAHIDTLATLGVNALIEQLRNNPVISEARL